MDTIEISSRRRDFMGCEVDCLSRTATLEFLTGALEEGASVILHSVVNANKVVLCYRNPKLAAAVNGADIINADGQSVVWFGRLAGIPIPERVTGIDIMTDLLSVADAKNLRLFLWGATEEVVALAVQRIKSEYPGIAEVGGRHGYFMPSEEDAIVTQIARFHPDIVFLGMSSPLKELTGFRYRNRLRAKIVMGVGGSFDIIAGVTMRAPLWLRKLGLEWLYRVVQEPSRLWKRYLVGNVTFLWLWCRWVGRGKPRQWGMR